MVEGTPLLREHALKKCIQGSNPCVSARTNGPTRGRIVLMGMPGETLWFDKPRGAVFGPR